MMKCYCTSKKSLPIFYSNYTKWLKSSWTHNTYLFPREALAGNSTLPAFSVSARFARHARLTDISLVARFTLFKIWIFNHGLVYYVLQIEKTLKRWEPPGK